VDDPTARRDAGPLLAWTVGTLTLAVCLSFVWLGTRTDGFGGVDPAGVVRDLGGRRHPPGRGRPHPVLPQRPRSTAGGRPPLGRADVLAAGHPPLRPALLRGGAGAPMLEERVRLLSMHRRRGAPRRPAGGPRQQQPRLPGDPRRPQPGERGVLAVAARLEAEEGRATMRRVALVSYGSPIAILYERYFRATLVPADGEGTSVYDGVRRSVHSWHHLFGLTEPFAFRSGGRRRTSPARPRTSPGGGRWAAAAGRGRGRLPGVRGGRRGGHRAVHRTAGPRPGSVAAVGRHAGEGRRSLGLPPSPGRGRPPRPDADPSWSPAAGRASGRTSDARTVVAYGGLRSSAADRSADRGRPRHRAT
jgi:hypothetical protein